MACSRLSSCAWARISDCLLCWAERSLSLAVASSLKRVSAVTCSVSASTCDFELVVSAVCACVSVASYTSHTGDTHGAATVGALGEACMGPVCNAATTTCATSACGPTHASRAWPLIMAAQPYS